MEKKILIIGAGLSTNYLIKYLAELAEQKRWKITIADRDEALAISKSTYERTSAVGLNIEHPEALDQLIAGHDVVISMLPAHMHMPVALTCLKHRKNLVTASYLSDEMQALNRQVSESGLIFLNEIGLDPGLDHLTAKKIIDETKDAGYSLLEFESFTGGLMAPEDDDNPWNYKFTWNPRNVVLAGQGGAVKFIQQGQYKYIPYHKVFRRTEIIEIDGYGKFEGYANRDSLKYIDIYGLQNIKTMFRGTLRRPGFCKAWNVFVSLGATDDSYTLDSENMTYRDFINTFLAYHPTDSVEIKLKYYLNIAQDDTELWGKLEWLDIFKPIKIGLKNATPAQILQHILERKWQIKLHEKDMIVMWHKFVYTDGRNTFEKHGSVVAKGQDQTLTSMSKTVGLPLGIATRLILENSIKSTGTLRPITPEFYVPILKELESFGIRMTEKLIS